MDPHGPASSRGRSRPSSARGCGRYSRTLCRLCGWIPPRGCGITLASPPLARSHARTHARTPVRSRGYPESWSELARGPPWRTRPRCDGRTHLTASLSVAVRRLAVSEPAPAMSSARGEKSGHARERETHGRAAARRGRRCERVEESRGRREDAGGEFPLEPPRIRLPPARSGSLEAGSSTRLLFSLSLSVILHPRSASVSFGLTPAAR